MTDGYYSFAVKRASDPPASRHPQIDWSLLDTSEQSAVQMYLRHDCELAEVPSRAQVFLRRHFPEIRS
jgi:hypothetical protein